MTFQWYIGEVLEGNGARGTILDENGRPATGENRALPDGEIAQGTPIPALVPLPGKPMAPIPGASVSISNGQAVVSGTGNPGFPFYVPSLAGHRPPKPPLDTIDDGGLPRHRINGGTFVEAHTRLDFHKEILTAQAEQLPEDGTVLERQAMAFHEAAQHPSCEPHGLCGLATQFATNGRRRASGAPFADPCTATAAGNPRIIKSADVEDDVKLNKIGSERRPRCSAGSPIRPKTTRGTTGHCGPSSPMTTSAPRPISRPASTRAWSSSRRARSGTTMRLVRRSAGVTTADPRHGRR